MSLVENSLPDRDGSPHDGPPRDGSPRDGSPRDGLHRDGLPPFVNSWKQLYILMIGTLLVLIVFFYLFMSRFQ